MNVQVIGNEVHITWSHGAVTVLTAPSEEVAQRWADWTRRQ